MRNFNKVKGDPLTAEEWNSVGEEIERLDRKIDASSIEFPTSEEDKKKYLRGDKTWGNPQAPTMSVNPNVDIVPASEAGVEIEEQTENNVKFKFSLPRGEEGKTYVPNVDSEGNLTWELEDNPSEIETSVNIKGSQGERGTGLTVSHNKDGKITTVTITTKEETPQEVDSFQINDGDDGNNGHNPCLGRFTTLPTLSPNPFADAQAGDYFYYDTTDQQTSDPVTYIYHFDGEDWDRGTVIDAEHPTFAGGQAVISVHIKDENGDNDPYAQGVLSAEAGGVLKETKMDKSYQINETSQLTATDTQYQTDYFNNYYGSIASASGFGVLGFDCSENQKLLITGSFGSGSSCLGVFKDDNGDVKGLVLQKPKPSPYNGTVVNDYYCEVPSGATKIYVQTNKTLLQNPSCKLIVNTTYRQYPEIILQNETDIDSIQADLEQLQGTVDSFDMYTQIEINLEWTPQQFLDAPTIGSAPSFSTDNTYKTIYIQNLQPGDIVNAVFRAGNSSNKTYGAKVKNGLITDLISSVSPYSYTFECDGSFDALILNDYIGYISNPSATLVKNVLTTEVLSNEIEDLQETVNDIIEQGVGGEFNMLCFGNSFTQDTISYIPWLIKECEPNLKLNVYFIYMGGMPISQCLAYISNGTTIALNGSGTPTTKYENHGGWDRIYSYSNGEWVEPTSGTTNYHKSYILYKYEDGANSWVSQSEPTAASVLQMKNWDLITIQQGGSINFESWDYYFKPYVYQIHTELQKQVKHNFTLGYLMTHASYSTSSETLLSRYNGIVQNATKMLENTPVEIVMPYATALQNARTTYLDRFGAGGHLMGDTAHVSDGVGCLVCAYANTMAILDLVGSKKSIVGSQIYPDAAWLSSHNIPAVSSTIEGLSRYNIWLAQQCAVMATKYPLLLTDMVAKGMCGDTEIEIVDDAVYSSNPILSANVGDSWNTVLSAPDGYTISNVVVMMGGTDVTSNVYNSATHAIDIAIVSAKVTITVTLVASA